VAQITSGTVESINTEATEDARPVELELESDSTKPEESPIVEENCSKEDDGTVDELSN